MTEEVKSTEEITKNLDLAQRVQDVIDKSINPALAMHGGFVELLEVKGEKVYVTMGGGCQGCAASQQTLKMGIASMLQEEIPEITDVIDGTDHSAGANPFMAG
jgi:Fe-S cluster biogenesis protein NfuA